MKHTISEIQLKYNHIKSPNTKITNSSDAYRFLRRNWNMDTIDLQEEFKILLLNRANEILEKVGSALTGQTGTAAERAKRAPCWPHASRLSQTLQEETRYA